MFKFLKAIIDRDRLLSVAVSYIFSLYIKKTEKWRERGKKKPKQRKEGRGRERGRDRETDR